MDKQKSIYLISFILLVVISIITFTNSKYFQIQEVEVIGNRLLEEAYLVDYYGLKEENILKLNRKDLANKLLELPEVKGASVSRSLPNKLIIEISERRPIGIVGLEAPYQIIDNEGWIIGTTNSLSSWPLPLFVGTQISKGGERVVLEDSFELVVGYLNILPSELLQEIYQVDISDAGESNLFLTNDIIIKLGLEFSIEDKRDILIAVYEDVKVKEIKVEYIDLRYDNNVIVKIKE